MMEVLEIVSSSVEWQKARSKVCGMMTTDDGYKSALNWLSECEDRLAKAARKIGEKE